MANSPVLTDTAAGVMTITLNRPEKMNAITRAMLDELAAALKKAEKDAAVGVHGVGVG